MAAEIGYLKIGNDGGPGEKLGTNPPRAITCAALCPDGAYSVVDENMGTAQRVPPVSDERRFSEVNGRICGVSATSDGQSTTER
jgi:hypothetical protein